MADAKITINLSKEDRELLQAVSTGLVDLIAVLTAKGQLLNGPQEPTQKPVEWPQTADTPPWEEEPAAPKKEAGKPDFTTQAPTAEAPKPTVTLDEIRKKVTALRANGTPAQKAEAGNIIKRRSANVSGLKPELWDEVWAELIALEQQTEG